MAGEGFGIRQEAVEQELQRLTATARAYSRMAEARASDIIRAGNTLNLEQAAAMATMYQSSVMMLQSAVMMMGAAKRGVGPSTGAQ